MGFGGGSKAPAPKPEPEPVVEPEKPTKRQQDDSAALRARRRGAGMRSLLSPTREEAATGLSNKLGGQ
jgi:hypothetical protein